MNLIVGLGNPGTKYMMTKHNFGYWIIDQLVSNRSLKFKPGKGDFVFAKNKIVIIDFKTGKLRENDAVQLKEYEEALKKMNYKNIEKILVYVNDSIEIKIV